MDIHAIALDLDGTVLKSDKTVSAHTLRVLARCRALGIRIIVATARSEEAAERFLTAIRPDAVISNGGALVRCNRETVWACTLPASIADPIIRALRAHPGFLSVTAQTDRGYYVSWENPSSGDYSHAVHYDFSSSLSLDVYKITVELSNADGLDQIAAAYPECGLIGFSDGSWYRFAHRAATKMNAIRHLAEAMQISTEQIIAFGDDHNDLEMLSGCGTGIAMGNAIDEVKAAADFICDTNDNDGVAAWLERNLL